MKIIFLLSLLATGLLVPLVTWHQTSSPAVKVNRSPTKAASSAAVLRPASCDNPLSVTEEVVCLAETFKSLLTEDQIATLEIELTEETRQRWSNLPCGLNCRNGLLLGDLTEAQQAAALAIVEAAAGPVVGEGYDEYQLIRAADDVLAAEGGGGGPGGGGYGSGIYIIAFLNTPSLTDEWMLQFGGHHYAGNITFNGGGVAGASPHFLGVEPLSWTDGDTTYAPMASEHDNLVAMFDALNTEELASAELPTTFGDVLLGAGEDGNFPATKSGLAVSGLSEDQKALVLDAMRPWVEDVDSVTAASLMGIYEEELDETYIAYSGNTTLENHQDYARIDGPSVWIEFVCQNGVIYPNQIHYHSIYRDHLRDYGASGVITSIDEVANARRQYQLGTNYPNPVTTSTTIPFTLNTPAHVQVYLYDMNGQKIAQLLDQRLGAGAQQVKFRRDKSLAAGSYVYQFVVENDLGQYHRSRVMILK